MKCGIVGLPNAGKSTLFKALTAQKVDVENYPFCTIEPNMGVVTVPDSRLEKLAQIFKSKKTIYPFVEFVDIAGLIKGAHKGEGLGYKFLSHIRESQALLHVVRCFEDKNIGHVYSNVDPCRDIEIVESELLLSDIETVQNRINKIEKPSKSNKEMQKELEVLKRLITFINDGQSALLFSVEKHELPFVQSLHLLTAKEILYICNVNDSINSQQDQYVESVKNKVGESHVLRLSGQLESELAELNTEEKKEYLKSLNMEEPALNRLIQKAYTLLDLITFFTAGEQETRGWTIKKGSLAPKAGGVIHSDFEKSFIRAETYDCQQLLEYGSLATLKSKGLYRLEGKNYIVQDGDVLHFRLNA